ncbi:MAG TPA: 23S rRNA (uracil(1939)-C(5))-methyltransferase RlmD [Bacteroidia bacterium]|jgi:23S rRNA (uracil1939-C5)-methyltransferase|nr:23S rRNA (uracil(1939)-C(5))-methyltransferase RlmD [Bacteroidia bacterium]
MKNKKPLPLLTEVTIIDAGTEGQSIGKVEDYVVFVKGAIPGDVVDVQVTRKKNKFREGKATFFHSYSERRTEPACEHFGTCGGCKWQNMKYDSQLFFKQNQVHNALVRIGKLDIPEINPIIGSANIYHYRNKLEFTFSNKKWLTLEQIADKSLDFSEGPGGSRNALGFHIPGLFDKVLDINTCHLQADPSNAIRLEVKKYAMEHNLEFFDIREQAGLLRNIIIRTTSTGEVMVIVIFFKNDKEAIHGLLEHLKQTFKAITSLQYVVNEKRNDTIFDQEVNVFAGNDAIFEQMENLRFRISPKSFYQTNSAQAYELYKVTREYAGLQGTEVVYDLYTGTGTIANFVAHQAKKVVGIETVEAAIADAKINSKLNNIGNTSFYAGDMKDVLNDAFIRENGKPDVIITDPPRAGMHEDVVRKIAEIRPKRIVYVSCNPGTQARDLAMLDEFYKVTKVQPVDMFPHTHHVENVVLLELKTA